MDVGTGHSGAGPRTALALLAFGMLASLAAGCATGTARPPRSEFEDIAVPRGLTYQPDKSTVIESPADDVLTRVAAVSQRRAIAAALARLSQPDRDTVLLVDWAELSYEQAASALRVPVGTVRSRLNRARRKVREALDSKGYDNE